MGPALGRAAQVTLGALAFVQPPAQPPYPPGYVACVDPLTLQPIGERHEIREFHAAWALSPDGRQLALGISSPGSGPSPAGRVGVRILDLPSLRVAKEIRTGYFADGLAWVGRRRLLARIGGDEAALLDPVRGTKVSRGRLPARFLVTGGGSRRLVTLGLEPPRVVSFDGRRVRTTKRLRGGVRAHTGMLVSRNDRRAYVFGRDRMAVVDLDTMRVRYRRLSRGRLPARPGAPPRSRSGAGWARFAQWVDGDRVAAAVRPGRGLALVDVRRARVRKIDAAATDVVVADSTVVATGPRGVRGYAPNGRRRFSVLADSRQAPGDVQALAGRVYAGAGGTTRVLDGDTGAELAGIEPPPALRMPIRPNC